jgi:hypothetical protein
MDASPRQSALSTRPSSIDPVHSPAASPNIIQAACEQYLLPVQYFWVDSTVLSASSGISVFVANNYLIIDQSFTVPATGPSCSIGSASSFGTKIGSPTNFAYKEPRLSNMAVRMDFLQLVGWDIYGLFASERYSPDHTVSLKPNPIYTSSPSMLTPRPFELDSPNENDMAPYLSCP